MANHWCLTMTAILAGRLQWFIVITLLVATRLRYLVAAQAAILPASLQWLIVGAQATSCGLLQEICDRLRKGKQKDEDPIILMRQSINFPEFTPDVTLHYNNNHNCSETNWCHLWSECKFIDATKRMYICRASVSHDG